MLDKNGEALLGHLVLQSVYKQIHIADATGYKN